MTIDLAEMLQYLPHLVLTLGALGWLSRRIEVIRRITERELEHNHGSSMKDDVHGLAVSMGKMARTIDNIDARVRKIESNQ